MKRGLPAAAVLAGGISRHGASCSCPYCVKPVIPSAYQRPIAEQQDEREHAYVNDERTECAAWCAACRDGHAISQAFSKAWETIAEIEAKRVEHVGGEWSPAQMARAS